MSEHLCTVTVNRGSGRWSNYQPCGRAVERDGKCKLHLCVDERRREADKKWKDKMAFGNRIQAEAKDLTARLGFKVTAEYSSLGKGGYTGNFVVPGDWLRAQADRGAPFPPATHQERAGERASAHLTELRPLYHVPRSQVWSGSRGRQTGCIHLHVVEPLVFGRLRRAPGQALCGKRGWYERPADEFDERPCPVCESIRARLLLSGALPGSSSCGEGEA